MSGSGDHTAEMHRNHTLDDVAIEAFFTGHEVGEELGPLAGFVEDLHSMASGPAPAPSPRLAAVLAEGIAADDDVLPATAPGTLTGPGREVLGSSWTRKRKLIVAELLTGLSLTVKAVLGVSAAAAAVTAGGAVGVLPGPVQHAVSAGVEAVTPFSFPDRAASKADFGGRISTDARDGGVDGATVRAEAKPNGAANPPPIANAPVDVGRPAAPGQKGLDQANTTPAAGHVPSAVPAGPPPTAAMPPENHPPTSIPAAPPTSTARGGAGTRGQTGPGTVSSTPAAEHMPGTMPAARPNGR